MPFFYLPGNHDVSNEKLLDAWKKRFGRTYYYFIYQNVLFLCMDSTGEPYRINNGDITEEEADYFEGVIGKHKKVRWTIVIMHKPAWERNGENWLRLEKTLGERDYTVFAGHEHRYAKTVRQGRTYIRVATTGGTSPLKGPIAGTFDHIMWVTMSDKGPRIANLMPDCIYDENATSYSVAAAAKIPKAKQVKTIVFEGEIGYSFWGKQPVTTKVTGRLPVVRQAHAASGGENN
jgi:hypothetical protein